MTRNSLLFSAVALLLNACSSLPDPQLQPGKPTPEALSILKKSAVKAGRPWQTAQIVEVGFSGEWSKIVKTLQPELVDADFRRTSREIYTPRLRRVAQTHTGPGGSKQVTRTPDTIDVSYNGQPSTSEVEKDAAALVADAYTMFVFGTDYLLTRGCDWRLFLSMRRMAVNDDPCWLISGLLKPGIGRSAEDRIILWISQRDHRLRRVQFTLHGLASTGGADVDVTFSDFHPGPQGTEWPRHFLETVRRPFTAKAHEWQMTELKVR